MGTRIEAASVEAGNRIQLLAEWRYEGQSDLLPAGTVVRVVEIELDAGSEWVRLRTDSGATIVLDGRDAVLLEDN